MTHLTLNCPFGIAWNYGSAALGSGILFLDISSSNLCTYHALQPEVQGFDEEMSRNKISPDLATLSVVQLQQLLTQETTHIHTRIEYNKYYYTRHGDAFPILSSVEIPSTVVDFLPRRGDEEEEEEEIEEEGQSHRRRRHSHANTNTEK